MRFFIDSAKLSEIEEAYSWGIIEGVTTNPSLIKKAVEYENKRGNNVFLENYIKKILKVAKGTPVSLEVTSTDYESMVSEAKNLFKKFNSVAKNVYIKIPVNPSLCDDDSCKRKDFDGIKAIRELSKLKIPVNCTLIFSPEQALMAAKAGAKLVSPFVGREDDFLREKAHIKFNKNDYFSALGIKDKGKDKKINDEGIISGVDLVKKCVDLLRADKKIKTEVLAASIRNKQQLREVAIAGADIVTLPFEVLKEIIVHHKTSEGMKNFVGDVVEEYSKLRRGIENRVVKK